VSQADTTTIPLGALGPAIPPRPRKESPSWWPYAIVAAVLLVILGCLVWMLAGKYAAPATAPMAAAAGASPVVSTATARTYIVPQPEAHITITESTGGTTKTTAHADGASIDLSGKEVNAKDLVIQPTVLGVDGVGGATGGGFLGSFSLKAGGITLLQWCGLAVFLGLGALAYLNWKKAPLDVHHTLSLAAGAVGGLVTFVQPEIWWVGLGAVAIAALVNFLPSMMGPKVLEAAKNYEDFFDVPANADVKARWVAFRAGMSTKDKNVIDTVIRKENV